MNSNTFGKPVEGSSEASGSPKAGAPFAESWGLGRGIPEQGISTPGSEAVVDVADIGISSSFGPPEVDDVRPNTQESRGDNGDYMRHPRPPMRKLNFTRPPPIHQPPPPPAPLQSNATDSLSLGQLKKLVSDFPQSEPVAYAFEYEDSASFPEELEEWFSYSESENIWRSRVAFEMYWEKIQLTELNLGDLWSWTGATPTVRQNFVARLVHQVESADLKKRAKALGRLLYIALGAWQETAGLQSDDVPTFKRHGTAENAFSKSTLQIKWIYAGLELIYDAMGIPVIYDALRGALLRSTKKTTAEPRQNGVDTNLPELEAMEQSFSLTLMYLFVEFGRQQISSGQKPKIRDEIMGLEPEMLGFLVKTLSKLRWNENLGLPVTKLSLLLWKSLLLLFGDANTLDDVRKALSEKTSSEPEKPDITATPLDYHLFRQEITSKYPAYNPPPPLLALELENNSILPPLINSSKSSVTNSQLNSMGPMRFASTGNSILQQPVHIATPVPSPPPSPAGPGGKAGKKQNYQTNQNFPFLYPPLDASSNGAGGKGESGRQELTVGKKWEGSDIPTSILEAGNLFAKRTRMTRATRQLWEERERYMKFERGWDATTESKHALDLHSKLKALGIEELPDRIDGTSDGPTSETSDHVPNDTNLQSRLQFVDEFYRHNISHLQSLVIVLLKETLATVTHLASQPGAWGSNGLGPGFQENGGEMNGARGRPEVNRHSNGVLGNGLFQTRPRATTDAEAAELVDTIRQREISSKAVSGCLLTLLKWFKTSHILKYEYMTQLLLDSNYLPLVLKLFAHQELDKAVECVIDRPELGFFAYCRAHSPQQPPETSGRLEESSEDEAIPPPIKLNRNGTQTPATNQAQDAAEGRRPPEVDELGYPTSEIPSTPIAAFAWRNLFSAINFLKIMQKVVRHKTHRNLLLVHYKSSTILRKILKVPQQDLRLYALKLFKGQVPYCGRKWRQSNMRVITAVYLHVPPELRDDWLAGGDVDAEVEEALPLEQALRALTHWWHCMKYPEQMGAEDGLVESEADFFARELERMDWALDDASEDMGRESWDGQSQDG